MPKINKAFCFFFLIAFSLALVWFKGGYIIALGESAIPFYNLQNLFKIYSHVWTPISLGFYQTPVVSLPFFSYGLIFELLGFPGFLVQAIVFLTLAFLILLNSYIFGRYLFRDLVSKSKDKALIFGSLFYLFNLVCLVSVWNRLQYPFILFYVSLPLALFVFNQGLSKRKLIYSLYLGLLLIPFSMAFLAIPFMELLWATLGAYALFHIIINKNKNVTLFTIFYFSLCGIVWFLLNSWWLLQFFQYTLTLSHDIYSLSGNVATLKILSQVQGNLSYVFRLMNRDLLIKMEEVWGSFYFIPLFVFLSYLIPFLAFFPLLIKKKPSYIYFFLGFSLIMLFLIKGSEGPFGEIFLFLFSNFRPLEVFRGAFEKFGLVLPLAYMPLIIFSIILINENLKRKVGQLRANLILLGTGILLFLVLTFPYWNGWIFTYYVPHANNLKTGDYVKVPDFYKDANNYLNKDSQDFRVVVLPIENDSVTYNWNGHGFTGLDYTNGLFSKSFVTTSFGVENLDFVVSQFQDVLLNAPQFFTKAMNIVNAKYLMVRKDIDYKYRTTMNPNETEKLIRDGHIPNLSFEKQFGDLYFYRNNNLLPKIFVAKNIYSSPQEAPWKDILGLTNFNPGDAVLNSGITNEGYKFIDSHASTELFYPQIVFNYNDFPAVTYSDALSQIPKYFRFLPGDRFYVFITLKERISLLLTKDPEYKFFNLLDLTIKRVAELQRVALDKDTNNLDIARKNYIASLDEFKDFAQKYDPIYTRNIQYVRYKTEVQRIILEHLSLTSSSDSIKAKFDESESKLDQISSNLGIIPQYPALQGIKKIIAYRYSLREAGLYEIMLSNQQIDKWYIFNTDNIPVQVNDKVYYVNPTLNSDFFDFGRFLLNRGTNEIQIFLPDSINLSISGNQGKLETTEGTEQKIFLSNFDPQASYNLKFEYKVNSIANVALRVNTDIDYQQNGKRDTAKSIDLDSRTTNWTKFTFPFNFYRGARNGSLSFIVKPNEDCPNGDRTPIYFKQCKLKRNTQPITFEYRNLSIERIFSNPIILTKTNNVTPMKQPEKVSYTRVDPTKFKVDVKGAKGPILLVFSENFDGGWKASFADNGEKISDGNHFLVNSFANAWYIDRKGDYQIILSYSAEDLYNKGKIISLFAIIGSVVIIILHKRKK